MKINNAIEHLMSLQMKPSDHLSEVDHEFILQYQEELKLLLMNLDPFNPEPLSTLTPDLHHWIDDLGSFLSKQGVGHFDPFLYSNHFLKLYDWCREFNPKTTSKTHGTSSESERDVQR